MNKKLIAIILSIVCVFSAIAGAVAASNSQTISAVLSFNTPIKYNGVVQEFKDATGKTVYPIMYEGTTYLPVRAVCGLANIPVDWDAATGTVLLGEKDKTIVNDELYKMSTSIWVDGKVTSDPSELVIDGLAYDYGIVAGSTTGDGANQCWRIGYFLTNQKYSKLHVKALCREGDTGTLVFRKNDENGSVLKEVKLTDGISQDVEINVTGSDKVWLGVYRDKGKDHNYIVITDMYLK